MFGCICFQLFKFFFLVVYNKLCQLYCIYTYRQVLTKDKPLQHLFHPPTLDGPADLQVCRLFCVWLGKQNSQASFHWVSRRPHAQAEYLRRFTLNQGLSPTNNQQLGWPFRMWLRERDSQALLHWVSGRPRSQARYSSRFTLRILIRPASKNIRRCGSRIYFYRIY